MYEHELDNVHVAHHQPVDTKKEYKKLAGVFGVIALCATLMSFVLGFDWQIWVEWFMGGFFIIFGSFKLIGYEDFITMFPTYDPIAKRISIYNYTYPFIELFLGFLFTANLLPIGRNIFVIIILSIGAYGIMQKLSNERGQDIHCACLGNVIKLPLSNISLIEDVLMVTMSALMLVSYFIF